MTGDPTTTEARELLWATLKSRGSFQYFERNNMEAAIEAITTALNSASEARSLALEEAARVAAGWGSSLRPGSDERLFGHEEAAREIADAIRALGKDDQ